MKTLPLLGLFRTGTNYTRTLLENNYDVVISYDYFGWKHGLIATYTKQADNQHPNIPPLVIVKNPYSTLYSWYQYYLKNNRNIKTKANNFSEFIRGRIIFYDESAAIKPKYSFSSPIEMWNCVVRNHISFARQMKGYVATYESLLLEPEATSLAIAEWFDIVPKNVEFTIPTNATRNMGENSNRSDISDYVSKHKFNKKDFFINKDYIKEYSKDDLKIMAESLDSELLAEFSYAIETDNDREIGSCEIFTVANDKMAKNLATLLFSIKQNAEIDLSCVNVIPFDDNLEKVKAVCAAFNVKLVKPLKKWDELGKALFKEEEYRPNVPAWRYFRKLNALSYAKENYAFLDANTIIFSSILPVFKALDQADVVFGNYSARGRNFKKPLTMILNLANPKIKEGFNAGFWFSKADREVDNILQNFIHFELRPYLTKSPEQSVLSIAMGLSGKKLAKIGSVCDGLCIVSAKKVVEEHDGEVVLKMGHRFLKVVAMKWTGKNMQINADMPNKNLYFSYLNGAIDFLIAENPEVFCEMTKNWLNT